MATQSRTSEEKIEGASELNQSIRALTILIQKLLAKTDQATQNVSGRQMDNTTTSGIDQMDQENQGNETKRFDGRAYERRTPNMDNGWKGAGLSLEKFDPEVSKNITNWVLQMENYFKVYNSTTKEKMEIASLHLNGRALRWYYWWQKMNLPIQQTWENLRGGLIEQYDDSWNTDYFAQLTRLHQQGTVQEYTEQFQTLQCMVSEKIPQECLLETYISGLKNQIKFRVKAADPPQLQVAIQIARNVEAELRDSRPTYTRRYEPPPYQTQNPNWAKSGIKVDPPLAIRNTGESSGTTKEEHIRKGTCFKCGGKWNKEHHCPIKKVFMINNEDAKIPEEAEEEVEQGQSIEREEDELLEGDIGNVQILLQAIIGQQVSP